MAEKIRFHYELHKKYDAILGRLVIMINDPSPWLLTKRGKGESKQA